MLRSIHARPIDITADLASLADLGKTMPGWDAERVGTILAGDPGLTVVALKKKKVVGFILASPDHEELSAGRIHRLCLDPSLPANALRELLFGRFLEQCTLLGFKSVSCNCSEKDAELMETCLAKGFEPVNKFIDMKLFLG